VGTVVAEGVAVVRICCTPLVGRQDMDTIRSSDARMIHG
jgi:hypothetical protein